MENDPYRVLGIKRGASDEQIKRAYHRLARQYHPDVNGGNAKAESRFKEINEAYAVLSDPEKRREYESADAGRRNAPHQTVRSAPPRRPSPPRPPSGVHVHISRGGQPEESRGITAGVDIGVSGLSAGLGIASGLLSGLERLVTSAERAASRKPASSQSERDIDETQEEGSS